MTTFRAPGRVNLIGDHTDYNDGFVMPMAIQLETHVASTPLDSHELVITSTAESGTVVIDLGRPLTPRGDWTDYVVGVAHVLQQEWHRVSGASLAISSSVPQGAGLSSSAALEVATAFALLHGQVTDRVEVARWCQRAENEFVGARVGIMDQYVSCLGRAGHALLIDCRSLEGRHVPVPDGVTVVVANTMVKHSIAGGEYNARRRQCEEAVHAIAALRPHVRSLRDVTAADLSASAEQLSPLLLKRTRHVVSENARVLQAAGALERGDVVRFGELMYESHASLRDDFEVSAPELDLMVDLARRQPGVLGSRMTGGGFGGSTVTLVSAEASAALIAALEDGYQRETGKRPDVIVCVPSDGASEYQA